MTVSIHRFWIDLVSKTTLKLTEHVSKSILLWIYLFPSKLHLIIVWNCNLVYVYSIYKNNLCWLAWEGEIDRNPVAVYYLFVCVNSKQTYHRLLKSYPPFICLLSFSLSPYLAHAPISSRLYIYDELKWKRLHFGRLSYKNVHTHTHSVKTEPAKSTSEPANQPTSCWLLLSGIVKSHKNRVHIIMF